MNFQQHNDSMLSKYQLTLEYSVYIISRLHVFLNEKATRGFNWCVSQICMKIPDFIKTKVCQRLLVCLLPSSKV